MSLLCKVPVDSFHFVSGHPLHFLDRFLLFSPAFDDGRTLRLWVDFPDQRGAVEDQPALFDRLEHHPLSGQGLANPPAAAFQVDGALAVDLKRSRALRIDPRRRIGMVMPRVGEVVGTVVFRLPNGFQTQAPAHP